MVEDLIRGAVRFENRTQDDFVIARGDGTPLYNLAVAVDDADMGITDVVRGDDHLSNTPKQLLVLRALDADPPRTFRPAVGLFASLGGQLLPLAIRLPPAERTFTPLDRSGQWRSAKALPRLPVPPTIATLN